MLVSFSNVKVNSIEISMCILDNKPAIFIPNLEAGVDWDQKSNRETRPAHFGTASKYC